MKRVCILVVLLMCLAIQAGSMLITEPHPQVQFDFGIASYAFREHSLNTVIECARQIGVSKLALKSMHLPMDSNPEQIEAISQQIKAEGLDLYAGAVIYMNSAKEVEQAFSYAQKAGMEVIVGVPRHDLLDLVEEKVKETGIKVAIHIHGSRKNLYPDAMDVYSHIKDRDPRLGICIDVGHTLRLNQDPAADIRKYRDRILDVQLWDCSSATSQGKAIMAGYGVMDIADILEALIEIDYRGTVSIEFWSDAKTPQVGTAQTLGYCLGILNQLPRQATKHNILSEAEKAAGWQLLFDGKTTQGWRSINSTGFPKHGWAVKDGTLRVQAQGGGESENGGDIITKEQYRFFELSWEWQMHTRGGNSGVKYAVLEGLSKNPKHGVGLEYQILDDVNHSWMRNGKMEPGDYRTTASLYELYKAKNKKLRPLGRWNRSRIVCASDRVEHWLNGIKVLTYQRGSEGYRKRVQASKFKNIPAFGEAKQGHILIQDHGGHVCFRNIKIRELP